MVIWTHNALVSMRSAEYVPYLVAQSELGRLSAASEVEQARVGSLVTDAAHLGIASGVSVRIGTRIVAMVNQNPKSGLLCLLLSPLHESI